MNDGVCLHFRQDDRTAAIALEYVNVDRHSDRHQIEFWVVTVMRIAGRSRIPAWHRSI